jgi:protein TonB
VAFTLVESRIRADKGKQFGVGAVSLAVHVAVIAGAVYATARAGLEDTTVKADTSMVFLAQVHQTAPPPQQLDVPLKGFQTLDVPTVIPTSVPPVDVAQHFDPSDYTGVGVEGGFASGVAPPSNMAYSEAAVDEHPELESRQPEYPDQMRLAGIQGRVLIQAIVDTLGRIEPSSIRIVQSPNPGFDEPVRAWAIKAHFRPARLRGRPVRVIISLPIDVSTGS